MYLCFCEFVYLCICVYVYLCIWSVWCQRRRRSPARWPNSSVFVYLYICVFVYLCIWYLVGLVPEEEEKSGRPGDLTPVSGLGRRGAAAQANYRFGILERLRQLPHSLSCLIPPCLPSLTATQVISWSSPAIPLYLDHGCSFTWKSISLKKSNQPLSSSNNLSNLELGSQIERYCPISQNQF